MFKKDLTGRTISTSISYLPVTEMREISIDNEASASTSQEITHSMDSHDDIHEDIAVEERVLTSGSNEISNRFQGKLSALKKSRGV